MKKRRNFVKKSVPVKKLENILFESKKNLLDEDMLKCMYNHKTIK